MQIAILSFDGFNEIDSFIAFSRCLTACDRGAAAVEAVIDYVSPVGEEADYVARVMAAVGRFALADAG